MNKRSRQQALVGEVVSDRMEKTVVIKVVRKIPHPIYKKFVKKFAKHFAHCDTLSPKIGDIVTVEECRPFSKSKTWKLLSGNNIDNSSITIETETQESQ